MEHHCNTCNKDFNDAKGLKDHRGYMRKQGKTQGHEVKEGFSLKGSIKDSIKDSIKGSPVGKKD
jgi:hypothetical protein